MRFFLADEYLHLRLKNLAKNRQHRGGELRARTFKCLWGPGIDSKEFIPPAYVAWRAGTITLFLLGS
jgi:hypothetical protein